MRRKRQRLLKGSASKKGLGSGKKVTLAAQWMRKESHVCCASEQLEEPPTGYFSKSQDGDRLYGVLVLHRKRLWEGTLL